MTVKFNHRDKITASKDMLNELVGIYDYASQLAKQKGHTNS